MPSTLAGTHDPAVEIKRLDPEVTNRTHGYPGLPRGTNVLVTTGGAVSEATVSLLKSAGCTVTVLGIAAAPTTASGCILAAGVAIDREACTRAVEGKAVVVHAGSPPAAPVEALAEATRNLLDAAAVAGVRGFVYASSASVVFGGQDLKTVSEDAAPYPRRFADPAAAAIAESEQAVLDSNAKETGGSSGGGGGSGAMLTCSIRAASLYGAETGDEPEERSLLPRLASRARDGARPIGDGKNVVDFVYAGNAAHALLLAAEALLEAPAEAAAVAGRSFFVTDVEPVPFAEFSGRALSRLGYPAPGGTGGGSAGIPVMLAAVLAFLLRVVALVVSPVFEFRPALTALRVAEDSTVRRFDTSRASKDLGYAPLWSQEEALDISLHAATALRNPRAKLKHIGPFSAAEVARHSSEDDAWIIVDGKVYDVTPYLEAHPGGDALLRNAGGDSTKGMHGPQHPASAMEILEQHYIGVLEET
ncbi:unnamed protein product [Scytosiphon promiscuus]